MPTLRMTKLELQEITDLPDTANGGTRIESQAAEH